MRHCALPEPASTCGGGLRVRNLAGRRWCRAVPPYRFVGHAAPDDFANLATALVEQHHTFLSPPSTPPPTAPQPEITCIASGLDNVQCFLEDGEPAATSAAGPQGLSATDDVWSNLAGQLAAAPGGELLLQGLQLSVRVSPFFFWGTSMALMKSVMAHTTPLALGAFRLLPAGAILIWWASARGRHHPATPTAWAWVTAFALVDAAAFQGFLAEGLTRTSAGLGSVIIDSQPLSVALMASLLFGERLSAAGVAGLLVGVAGLGLLELPGDSLQEAAGTVLSGAWRPTLPGGLASLADSGEFWMLMAAQSMAVGTIMARYVTKHVDPIMATGWHMLLGGSLLAAIAAAGGGGGGADANGLAASLAHFTPSDCASMAYVSVLGGAASYGIFFYNASHGSLTSLSSLTFLTPVFAAAAGYAWLGETLTPVQLMGAAVTLSSLTLINHKPQQKDEERNEAAS